MLRGVDWKALWRRAGLASVMVGGVCGCGESADHQQPLQEPVRVGSTRGSAVVLSRDERVAVVANRSAGVVTVLHLDPNAPLERLIQKKSEVDLGEGSEPWAAVIGADDDTAYVISRRDQSLRRILELRRAPRLDGEQIAFVGSEPTGIAITPSGERVFVANWAEGTISVVTTDPFQHRAKVDLNVSLAATGFLGNQQQRLALAHPRALAMTDDGDTEDGDETLYITEFFSQPLPKAFDSQDLTQFDRNRQGVVYSMSVATGQLADPITIAPIEDTGFADAPNMALSATERRTTSCIPNQLYAAAVNRDQLFVTSMCASPAGPLGPATFPDKAPNPGNFKTVAHPVIFSIDTAIGAEIPDGHRVLTRELEAAYKADGATDIRMPLIPNDIAFLRAAQSETPDEESVARRALVTAMGADSVFTVDYDPPGLPLAVGRSGQRFIDLHPSQLPPGKLPIGVATSSRSAVRYAMVANDNSQNVSVVDLMTGSVVAVEPTAEELSHVVVADGPSAHRGREFFATGLSVWSLGGQAWNSCETCHPDGLSDGLTWFFARGSRRTLSAAGTYSGDQRRLMLWTASIDEVHDIEAIVRSVAGGTGAVLWTYPGDRPDNTLRIQYDGASIAQPGPKPSTRLLNNMNGSLGNIIDNGNACVLADATCDNSLVTDWDDIDAFVRSVRAPRKPTELLLEEVAAGERLFREGRCAGCHGGAGWTLSRVFYPPGDEYNGTLPYARPTALTPEHLGKLRAASYSVPRELAGLNPPGASGAAALRRWDPGTRDPIVHLYGKQETDGYDSAGTHTRDQINCALRAVGTFPVQPAVEPWNTRGIVPTGAPPVLEVRADMKTLALGETGFNVPSLVGLATGAPYFHAGNARTLEEVFDETFSAHHQAFSANFLDQVRNRPQQVRELVAYLLSIDDSTPPEPVPSTPFNPDLCPDLLP